MGCGWVAVGVAKKGVGVSAELETPPVEDAELADLGVEAAAAAAAWRLAMLDWRNNGTPEKALKLEASLSAASCRFHLFLRFWNHIFT